MKEYEIINIDNKEYALLDTIKDNNITYNYFVNSKNPTDFCILKDQIIDNKKMYVNLDNKEEVDKALLTFQQKHQEENKILSEI